MALVPPPNAVGVMLPANPQNPPTFMDIANSKEYVARLDHTKRFGIPGAATDDEIGSAERYHHDVVMMNSVMGPVPPPWLAPLMGAAPPWLMQFVNNIQAGINQVQASINQVQADMNEFRAEFRTDMNEFRAEFRADMDHLRADMNCLHAQQENARIGKLNYREVINNTGITTYHAKRKEVAGDGTAFANALLPQGGVPLAPLQAIPVVGARPRPMINTHLLEHHHILAIIQYYNQDFGIQQNETVSVRRKKIENWLTLDA